MPKNGTDAQLTAKQEKFCREYLVDLNATQAAIRAGYSQKTARSIASALLTKADIQARVQLMRAELAASTEITPERVLAEYAKLAFANMADFIQVQDDGTAYVYLADLTRDQAAALSEMTVDEYTEGRGDEARNVKRVKIKLSDKKGALDSISRVLGTFVDRHEVTGKGGGPIKSETKHDGLMTSEQIGAALQGWLDREESTIARTNDELASGATADA